MSPATCMYVIEQVRICFDYTVHYYICYFQAVRLIIHLFIKVTYICRYHKTIHANVLFGSKPRIAFNHARVRGCDVRDGTDSKRNFNVQVNLCAHSFCNQGPNKLKLSYDGNVGLNIRIILPTHD